MTVADLIKQEVDIDVYDDVCEAIAIAFCGPLHLTADGESKFAEVLTYEVELHNGFHGFTDAVVIVDDQDDAIWRRKLHNAKEFFEAAAGFCSENDYEAWFKED